MADYANYVGRKINSLDKLQESFDNYNHIILLNSKQVFGVSMCGWFYTNIMNGDNYVISDYGIGKFNKSGIDWVINAEKDIEKFLKINQKISNDFIDKDNSYETKPNVRNKLGL